MAAAETSILFSNEGWFTVITAVLIGGIAWGRAEMLAIGHREKIKELGEADKALAKDSESLHEKCEKESRERSDDVKRIALDAHTQGLGIQAQLSMFREKVASDYVSREMIRDLEGRLSADMDRISANVENMGHNIGLSVNTLADRLDRVLEGRGK